MKYWRYLPIVLLLGLIWYEFWKSTTSPPATSPLADSPTTRDDSQPIAGVESPENGRSGSGSPPFPKPEAPTERIAAVLPASEKTGDSPNPASAEQIAARLPPISLNVDNAPLAQVIDALQAAVGPDAKLAANNTGRVSAVTDNGRILNVAGRAIARSAKRYTLHAKDQPFWEVFRALASQNSLLIPVGSVPLPHPTMPLGNALIAAGPEELTINESEIGIHHFEVNGPVILYPAKFDLERTSSGTLDGNSGLSRYSMHLITAVDPRIQVIKCGRIAILEAIDERGKTLDIPPPLPPELFKGASNAWLVVSYWDAPEYPPIRANFKCEVRFTAQLTQATTKLENPQSQVGNTFTVGNRDVRLSRFDVSATQISFQLSPLSPGDMPVPITGTLIDSKGATSSLGVITTAVLSRSIPLAKLSAPFHLEFTAPDRTTEMVFPFELKNIPLP